MPPLIKTNNQNYRCLNCGSPHCVLKISDDGVLEYYECLKCGQKDIAYIDYFKKYAIKIETEQQKSRSD